MIKSNILSNRPYLYISLRQKSKFKGLKVKDFKKVVYEYQNVPPPDREFEPDEFLPRRLTYVPPDLPQNIPGKRLKPWRRYPKIITIYPNEKPTKEWNEEAQYPDLIDDPKLGFFKSKTMRLEWYDKIRKLPSVDEKIVEIVDQISHKMVNISSAFYNYGHLPMWQYMTKTHLIKNKLPQIYDEIQVPDSLIKSVVPKVKDLIEACRLKKQQIAPFFKAGNLKQEYFDEVFKQINIARELNTICYKALVKEAPYLLDSQVSYDVDIRSWWYAANMKIPEFSLYFKKHKIETFDQPVLFKGSATLQIRMPKPLKPVLSQSDPLVTSSEIPYYPYNPAKQGYSFNFNYFQTLPGFFHSLDRDPSISTPDDPVIDFPFFIMDHCFDIKYREILNEQKYDDENDVLCGKALMLSFAYLNSLASYHGFTNYDEMTYPLVNQGLITDGDRWVFSVYQLNSHRFHSDFNDTKRNICWTKNMTGEKLEDIIKILFKMMLNKPTLDDKIVYRPYLAQDTRDKEKKLEQRTILRERFSGYHVKGKIKILRWMKVFPYEWLYLRNPNCPRPIHWRILSKPKLDNELLRHRYFK